MEREAIFKIPSDQRLVADWEVFSAFDLSKPGLTLVRNALEEKNLKLAKRELIRYFEIRKNPIYYYDYRSVPLRTMETDDNPYVFQAALGLKGSLKEFCLYAGRKLMNHIYVRPGGEMEFSLGENYEQMPHFSFPEDQGKKHRTILDIFVRGQMFEYLAVLYHETGERRVLDEFSSLYRAFFQTYPLVIEEECISEGRFSMKEERDIMSTGFLAISMIGLIYTRLPYEIPYEESFEILKNLWYLGIQFRRFDFAPYQDYNHHLWEKGIVPYVLGVMFPEIPDLGIMQDCGRQVINQHIMRDFNSHGGYSEHSISYWGGAALGEMLFRGVFLANRNGLKLLEPESKERIERTACVLAMIAPPGETFPSFGDGGGLAVNNILINGIKMSKSRKCSQVLAARRGEEKEVFKDLPLDFCDTSCGFACSRSSYAMDGNYFLMSVKKDCGESGHNHMDMLSLSIFFRGKELIGEPYARAIYHRAKMGSTIRGYLYNMGSHNTVLAYSNPIVPDNCFSDKWGVYRPDSPVDTFFSMEKGVYLEAHHDAYGFCRHKRSVLLHRKKGLWLRDEIMRGNRMPSPHIQRWHMMPGVDCTQLDHHSVLLQKEETKVLCVWSGMPKIQLWKMDTLYPDIIKSQKELGIILDVCFTGYDIVKGDLASVSQCMVMVDVTGEMLNRRVLEELTTRISKYPKTEREAEQMLEWFDHAGE